MWAQRLRALLGKGNLVADNLRDAADICGDWFAAEPGPATFILRSLFRDLQRKGWDDPQGVSATDYEPFERLVLPRLTQIAEILAATPAAEPMAELDGLVVAYRDSCQPTP